MCTHTCIHLHVHVLILCSVRYDDIGCGIQCNINIFVHCSEEDRCMIAHNTLFNANKYSWSSSCLYQVHTHTCTCTCTCIIYM